MSKCSTISSAPWRLGLGLADEARERVLRRAIFDCMKWHLVASDRLVVHPSPLVIARETWDEVAALAEALEREAASAERELLERGDLHEALGIPKPLRAALREVATRGAARSGPRVTRYDFHWTTEGWRISEGNSDVAGGFIEASGVTALFAREYPELRATGDPAGALARAMRAAVGPGATVGLMHLSTFTEDRQVVLYLAKRLGEEGLATCLFDPGQVSFANGRAAVVTRERERPLDALFRFFPADWLPRMDRASGWTSFFAGSATPLSNPAWAVLSQTKRFPLAWNSLATRLDAWRRLLPETRAPERAPHGAEWVLKPALAHEGKDVAIRGALDDRECDRIAREARRDPLAWVAQRRFDVVPLASDDDGDLFPSLGVYVIDGRAAGAYARAASRPLIDPRARELIVLVDDGGEASRA